MGRGWAQDAGPVPRIHPHGSWHYARIVPVSTVTDRRVIGMVLKTKRRTDGKSGKSCLGAKAEVDGGEDASSAERRGRTPGRIVVQRLQDNEDGSKGETKLQIAYTLHHYLLVYRDLQFSRPGWSRWRPPFQLCPQ
eukprot:COSAG06_NODE_33609_length_487_cov_0.902062_1_plen_135_part_10